MRVIDLEYTPEQIQAIKELANNNIVKIFMALKIYDGMRDKYPKYINGICPLHNGNNSTAFSWDYNLGIFKCWTRGCHEAGNDVYGLVEQLLEVSFVDAIDWVVKTLDINLDDLKISHDIVENINFIRNAKKSILHTEKIIKEEVLSKLDDATDYIAQDRGFKKEVISLFEPKHNQDNVIEEMNGRIIFPVRNVDGYIVGFSGRRINEEDIIPKWRHSSGFEKNNYLYNMHRAKKHIEDTGTMILVEGPFDIMAFENAGINNAVAVLGRELSIQQRSLIWSSGAFEIILAFDRDKSGKEATDKIEKELKKYLTVKRFKISEDKKDVGEMDVEDIRTEYTRLKEM